MKKPLAILFPLLILLISCGKRPEQDKKSVSTQNSLKHTLIRYSENRYDGLIGDGSKEKGNGIFTIISGKYKGNRYEGEFLAEHFHGQGTWLSIDSLKYVGEFKDGKFHGSGTYTFPDGRKYVGEFKDGKYNGSGTYTFPDGVKVSGEFKDGKYTDEVSFTLPNGWYLINGYLVGPGADLEKANLVDAELTGADLKYANLRDADLSKAYLFESNLCNSIPQLKEH